MTISISGCPYGHKLVKIGGKEFPIPTLEYLEEQHEAEKSRSETLKKMEVNDREPYHLKFTNLQLIEPLKETAETDGSVFEYHEWQEKFSGTSDRNTENIRVYDISAETAKESEKNWKMFIELSFDYAKNGGQKLLNELIHKQRKTYLHIGTISGDIVYSLSSKLKLEKIDFTKYYDWVMKRCKETTEHGESFISSGHLYEFVMASNYIKEAQK